MNEKQSSLKKLVIASTVLSLLAVNQNLSSVFANEQEENIEVGETGVDEPIATDVDLNMTMDRETELKNMVQAIQVDELTLEDETLLDSLRQLIEETGSDRFDEETLDKLMQAQEKISQLKGDTAIDSIINTLDETVEEKEIVRFEGLEKDVYLPTDWKMIRASLPTTIKGYTAEGEEVEVNIKQNGWSKFDPEKIKKADKLDFEWVKSNLENFEFTVSVIGGLSNIILPDGYKIKSGVFPEVKCKIVFPTITEVNPIQDIHALVGTESSVLGLPKVIYATIDSEDKKEIEVVEWKCAGYDKNQSGTYEFSAVIGDEYELAKDLKIKAKVILVDQINITNFEPVKIEVRQGDSFNVPNTVLGNTEWGDQIKFNVVWNFGDTDINNLPVGIHPFTGTVTGKEGYVFSEESATLNIHVVGDEIRLNEELEPVYIELDHVQELELPTTLDVININTEVSTTVKVKEWRCDRQEQFANGMIGEYHFTPILDDSTEMFTEEPRLIVYLCKKNNNYELFGKSEKYAVNRQEDKITSESITISENEESVTIEIGENANGDLIVDMNQSYPTGNIDIEINGGVANRQKNTTTILPGESIAKEIKIINKSGKTYRLKANSIDLSTINYNIDGEAVGFDGLKIDADHSILRVLNTALKNLVKDSENYEDEDIEKYLKINGYAGDGALSNYYLDFYKGQNDVDRLEDLPTYVLNQLLDSGESSSIRETNLDLIALGYDHLYNQLFNVSFGNVSYPLGDYMRNKDHTREIEHYFTSQIGELDQNEEISLTSSVSLAKGSGNAYQGNEVGYHLSFELEEVKEDDPYIPPTRPDRPDPNPEEEIEEEKTPEVGGEEEEIPEEEIEEEETPEVGNKDDVTDTGVASMFPWSVGFITSLFAVVVGFIKRRK